MIDYTIKKIKDERRRISGGQFTYNIINGKSDHGINQIIVLIQKGA